MDKLTELLSTRVQYQKVPIDNLPGNPYEVAVAAAKYAREVNEKVRKITGNEIDLQPRSIAMQKLIDGDFSITYPAPVVSVEAAESDEAE